VKLTHHQQRQLSEALRDAYTKPRLTQMLWFRLGKQLEDITLGEDFEQVVFQLVRRADSEGWADELVLAARASNPGNIALREFAKQVGLASVIPPRQDVERVIRETNSFLDPAAWRARLAERESCVCRVEVNVGRKGFTGTGFLVAPDVVITNFHVLAPLLPAAWPSRSPVPRTRPKGLVVRFDYQRHEDGLEFPSHVRRPALEDWLIDFSPQSRVDRLPDPKTAVPELDELDYVLFRLEEEPVTPSDGGEPVRLPAGRGWIEVPSAFARFEADTPLFILQHPSGEPLQLALDTQSIIGENGNGTRVFHRTNTLPGSSGSPCFNQNWELVALHRGRDPNFDSDALAYNSAVPFAAVTALLENRGLANTLRPSS